MGSFSIWHWLIVLAVVLLLFGGGGKIPRLMKDVGSGIRNFRKGLSESDDQEDESADSKDSPKLEKSKEENLESSPEAKKKSKAVNG